MEKGKACQALYDELWDFSIRVVGSDRDLQSNGFLVTFDAGTDIKWDYDVSELDYDELLSVAGLFFKAPAFSAGTALTKQY